MPSLSKNKSLIEVKDYAEIDIKGFLTFSNFAGLLRFKCFVGFVNSHWRLNSQLAIKQKTTVDMVTQVSLGFSA